MGAAADQAGAVPSSRLRDNHTTLPPTPHPGLCSYPGLSPEQINLQALKLGKGWGAGPGAMPCPATSQRPFLSESCQATAQCVGILFPRG